MLSVYKHITQSIATSYHVDFFGLNTVFGCEPALLTVAALHQARQVKWPGWKIHRPGSSPGSSPGSALPSPAYCFASVIMWTKNKNVTISDRFICFILTIKQRRRPVFRGRQLKKVNFFEEKSASGWPGWKIFWPRNDLAPLLRWRRHCLVFTGF